MVFQPVLNTAQFIAKFLLGGVKTAQFSLYCHNDDAAWDAAQLSAVGEALSDAIVADYIPALSVDHQFVGVQGRDLEQEFGRVEDVDLAVPAAGTHNSPSLPWQNAVVATFKSATGQPRRGRIYLMPPCEDQVAASTLTGGALAALQTAVESMSAAVGAGVGPVHVIVSRYQGRETKTVQDDTLGELVIPVTKKRINATTAEVAAVQVKSRVDTQRRRLLRESA